MATVFCDDNKKYLSTDLCSDEECKEHYRCNDVELLDFRVCIPAPPSDRPVDLADITYRPRRRH